MSALVGKIQLRRGTTSEWSTANTVLLDGELGIDSTLGTVKKGSSGGFTWNSIPRYYSFGLIPDVPGAFPIINEDGTLGESFLSQDTVGGFIKVTDLTKIINNAGQSGFRFHDSSNDMDLYGNMVVEQYASALRTAAIGGFILGYGDDANLYSAISSGNAGVVSFSSDSVNVQNKKAGNGSASASVSAQYGINFSKVSSGGQPTSFELTNGLILVQSSVAGFSLKYGADYSANFDDRSLIDKGYAAGNFLDLLGLNSMLGVLYLGSASGVDMFNTGGSDVMNIGTANADIINIGHAGATINLIGSVLSQQVTNLEVNDKLIRLNKGGAAASGVSVGFEIEEGGVVTGYFTTNGTRDGFLFQGPNSYESMYNLGALTNNRTHTLPDFTGMLLIDAESYSNPSWLTALAWPKLTGVPTTLAGYGLDDDVANMRKGSFGIVIDGGGNAITTGLKGECVLPFDCTITGWTITETSDTPIAGSIVVDVWKDTYANHPATVADTIAGSEKPTLSSATKNQDLTLTTWTTAGTAGDVVSFKVDSATSVKRVTVTIHVTKS